MIWSKIYISKEFRNFFSKKIFSTSFNIFIFFTYLQLFKIFTISSNICNFFKNISNFFKYLQLLEILLNFSAKLYFSLMKYSKWNKLRRAGLSERIKHAVSVLTFPALCRSVRKLFYLLILLIDFKSKMKKNFSNYISSNIIDKIF